MANDQAQDFGGLEYTDQSAVLAEMRALGEDTLLLIPDYDPDDPKPYPGDIKPGRYAMNDLVQLLRENRENPEAIEFIADMLEE